MTLADLDRYTESAAACECCDCTCAGDGECGICADCGCHHHDIPPLVAEIQRLRGSRSINVDPALAAEVERLAAEVAWHERMGPINAMASAHLARRVALAAPGLVDTGTQEYRTAMAEAVREIQEQARATVEAERDEARAEVTRLTGALGAIASLQSASKPVRDIVRDALLDVRRAPSANSNVYPAEAMTVQCDTCGALPGVACVTVSPFSERTMKYPHESRYGKARQARPW